MFPGGTTIEQFSTKRNMKNTATPTREKESIQSRIKDFFTDYEKRYAEALSGNIDVEATAAVFADAFIEANPFGVNAGKNDEAFRKAIPEGMEFYRKIGTQSMEVGSVAITTVGCQSSYGRMCTGVQPMQKKKKKIW